MEVNKISLGACVVREEENRALQEHRHLVRKSMGSNKGNEVRETRRGGEKQANREKFFPESFQIGLKKLVSGQ